ncbi:MAG: hypothetical protein JEY96_09740 [Bacteroidales bacterium]|nr:hypothetical protein [Bacteroidales bacterium]
MSTYGFLPIVVICLIIYLISYLFTKKKSFKFITHRRIWNLLLLISFLVAGTIGIVMAFIYSFELNFDIPYAMLQIHVGFGTVWFIIATFHFFWHLTYFKKAIKILFASKKN